MVPVNFVTKSIRIREIDGRTFSGRVKLSLLPALSAFHDGIWTDKSGYSMLHNSQRQGLSVEITREVRRDRFSREI